jgi:hypothetical protein
MRIAMPALVLVAVSLLGVGCKSEPKLETDTSASLGIKAVPKKPSRAKIDVTCGKNTYTLDTGTGNGSCTAGVGAGTCGDGDNKAAVNCDYGCTYASGSGTCTKN